MVRKVRSVQSQYSVKDKKKVCSRSLSLQLGKITVEVDSITTALLYYEGWYPCLRKLIRRPSLFLNIFFPRFRTFEKVFTEKINFNVQ